MPISFSNRLFSVSTKPYANPQRKNSPAIWHRGRIDSRTLSAKADFGLPMSKNPGGRSSALRPVGAPEAYIRPVVVGVSPVTPMQLGNNLATSGFIIGIEAQNIPMLTSIELHMKESEPSPIPIKRGKKTQGSSLENSQFNKPVETALWKKWILTIPIIVALFGPELSALLHHSVRALGRRK